MVKAFALMFLAACSSSIGTTEGELRQSFGLCQGPVGTYTYSLTPKMRETCGYDLSYRVTFNGNPSTFSEKCEGQITTDPVSCYTTATETCGPWTEHRSVQWSHEGTQGEGATILDRSGCRAEFTNHYERAP